MIQVSHHPPISAAHAENEHFVYDITSKVKTKFLGNSVDVYPLGRWVALTWFHVFSCTWWLHSYLLGFNWLHAFQLSVYLCIRRSSYNPFRTHGIKTKRVVNINYLACSKDTTVWYLEDMRCISVCVHTYRKA